MEALRKASSLNTSLLTWAGTSIIDKLYQDQFDNAELEETLHLISSRMDNPHALEAMANNKEIITALMSLVEKYSSSHGLFAEALQSNISQKSYEYCLYILLGAVEKTAHAKTILKETAPRDLVKDFAFSIGSVISCDVLYFTQEMALEILARLCHVMILLQDHTLLQDVLRPLLPTVQEHLEDKKSIISLLSNMRSVLNVINQSNPNIVTLPLRTVQANAHPLQGAVFLDLCDSVFCIASDSIDVYFKLNYTDITIAKHIPSQNALQVEMSQTPVQYRQYFHTTSDQPACVLVIQLLDSQAMETALAYMSSRCQTQQLADDISPAPVDEPPAQEDARDADTVSSLSSPDMVQPTVPPHQTIRYSVTEGTKRALADKVDSLLRIGPPRPPQIVVMPKTASAVKRRQQRSAWRELQQLANPPLVEEPSDIQYDHTDEPIDVYEAEEEEVVMKKESPKPTQRKKSPPAKPKAAAKKQSPPVKAKAKEAIKDPIKELVKVPIREPMKKAPAAKKTTTPQQPPARGAKMRLDVVDPLLAVGLLEKSKPIVTEVNRGPASPTSPMADINLDDFEDSVPMEVAPSTRATPSTAAKQQQRKRPASELDASMTENLRQPPLVEKSPGESSFSSKRKRVDSSKLSTLPANLSTSSSKLISYPHDKITGPQSLVVEHLSSSRTASSSAQQYAEQENQSTGSNTARRRPLQEVLPPPARDLPPLPSQMPAARRTPVAAPTRTPTITEQPTVSAGHRSDPPLLRNFSQEMQELLASSEQPEHRSTTSAREWRNEGRPSAAWDSTLRGVGDEGVTTTSYPDESSVALSRLLSDLRELPMQRQRSESKQLRRMKAIAQSSEEQLRAYVTQVSHYVRFSLQDSEHSLRGGLDAVHMHMTTQLQPQQILQEAASAEDTVRQLQHQTQAVLARHAHFEEESHTLHHQEKDALVSLRKALHNLRQSHRSRATARLQTVPESAHQRGQQMPSAADLKALLSVGGGAGMHRLASLLG